MKYLLIILSVILISSCCKPAGITSREEIKYIYKDSIRYTSKADLFTVYDTIPFVNFIPYKASSTKVIERIVYRSDGTFRKKFDSLYMEYSLLDSTFKLISNSSPDTVYMKIETVPVIQKECGFFDTIYRVILGIVIGFITAILISPFLKRF